MHTPESLAPRSVNQLILSARWVERAALRYTPAGLPALDLVLEHLGQTAEAGQTRKVEMRIRAVAIGPLARELQTVPADTQHLWCGFMAAARNGKGVVMHLTGIQALTPTNS